MARASLPDWCCDGCEEDGCGARSGERPLGAEAGHDRAADCGAERGRDDERGAAGGEDAWQVRGCGDRLEERVREGNKGAVDKATDGKTDESDGRRREGERNQAGAPAGDARRVARLRSMPMTSVDARAPTAKLVQ